MLAACTTEGSLFLYDAADGWRVGGRRRFEGAARG